MINRDTVLSRRALGPSRGYTRRGHARTLLTRPDPRLAWEARQTGDVYAVAVSSCMGRPGDGVEMYMATLMSSVLSWEKCGDWLLLFVCWILSFMLVLPFLIILVFSFCYSLFVLCSYLFFFHNFFPSFSFFPFPFLAFPFQFFILFSISFVR